MSDLNWTAEQRRAFYTYLKKRKRLYRDLVCRRLQGKCHGCGVEDSPTNELRIRFKDSADPLKAKYRTNPGTLHRRLIREPVLRKKVVLLCNLCKLKRSVDIDIS